MTVPSDHSTWSFAVFGMLLFAFVSAITAVMRSRLAGNPRPAYSLLMGLALLLVLAFVIAYMIGVEHIKGYRYFFLKERRYA